MTTTTTTTTTNTATNTSTSTALKALYASALDSDIIVLTKRQKVTIAMVTGATSAEALLISKDKSARDFQSRKSLPALIGSALVHAHNGQFTPLQNLLFTVYGNSRIGAPSAPTKKALLQWSIDIAEKSSKAQGKPGIVAQLDVLCNEVAPVLDFVHSLTTINAVK